MKLDGAYKIYVWPCCGWQASGGWHAEDCADAPYEVRALSYGCESRREPVGRLVVDADQLDNALSRIEALAVECERASAARYRELELAKAIIAATLYHEPQEECEHGFSSPEECPNDRCFDRLRYRAWWAGIDLIGGYVRTVEALETHLTPNVHSRYQELLAILPPTSG